MQQSHPTSPTVSVISEGRIFNGIRTPRAYVWLDTGVTAAMPKNQLPAASPREQLTHRLRSAKIADRDRAQHLQQLRALSPQALANLHARVQALVGPKR